MDRKGIIPEHVYATMVDERENTQLHSPKIKARVEAVPSKPLMLCDRLAETKVTSLLALVLVTISCKTGRNRLEDDLYCHR